MLMPSSSVAGVMRSDLRAYAVFERRNNLAASGVVFWVRGEDQGHVERQTERIAFNLDVALLHDVEHADLNFSRKVRQFVDGKQPAVSTGKQAVMHGHFARKIVPAARGFDGINVANQISDGHVRRGQLFHVAIVGRQVGDGCVVTFAGNQVAAAFTDRFVRIVANLAAGNIWQLRVEQSGKGAQNAALGLSAQAEQNKVMP